MAAFLLLLLPLAFLSYAPITESYVFTSQCAQPTSGSCPSCCKNLRNLAISDAPAVVHKNINSADKCISLCANHTYYGLSNRQVCGCFDGCSSIEVPPMPFKVTSGLISACTQSCYTPPLGTPQCQCPRHATCLPGKDGEFRCCCKAPFSMPLKTNGEMICAREHGLLSLVDS